MKTNWLIMAVALVLVSYLSYAQDFKLAKNSGKLVLHELNDVTLEGHAGNEIIFSLLDAPREKDKRAEGLRAVSNMGLEDNTGLGLSVQDKGTTIEVYQLKKMGGPRIKILVPKGVTLSVTHTSPYGSDITFRNIESEIEVSTMHNGIHLENVTGPLMIKTVHGEIEAILGSALKSPISLVSVHGLIDVSMLTTVKADISLSTGYGEIFVDPAIKIEFPEKNDFVKYGANKVAGKINGGGLEVSLSSSHGTIYVRKK